MKILASTHSTARVIGNTIDTGLFHNPNHEDSAYNPYVDYPVHYRAKVQICLLRCIWITVWSVTVNFSDDGAVEAANKRAEEIADTLSCTGL